MNFRDSLQDAAFRPELRDFLAGGTSEIRRIIIAQRGLGVP